MEIFRELLELSQRDKKGLIFHISGQVIGGYVVHILDEGKAVEVRNQTHSRIIIRLERVDAVSMN